MGRIGKLLSFARVTKGTAKVSDVTFDPAGGDNITGNYYSDAGDDSHPISGIDFVLSDKVEREGGFEVVGFIDPLNDQKASLGEKRIYARDPSSGVSVVELWLKNDGSAVLSNALGSIELLANGDVNINGAIIDTTGKITSPTAVAAPSILAAGKELAGHDHNILGGSSAPGPTDVNN